MTIQDIKKHLDTHCFLIFKYESLYYSLQKVKTLFQTVYRLINTDMLCQQRDSLEKLFNQVNIRDGIILREALNDIELPKWDDPSWESYEAVRHSVAVYRNEIYFLYEGRYFWISHSNDGQTYLSDDFGNTQRFNSSHDLFRNARIDSKSLKDIWETVIVESC